MIEKIFPTDKLSKCERVEYTLNFQPVDRVVLYDYLGYNPGVISLYTGKKIKGFNYTVDDIGAVIRRTLDISFPPQAPKGKNRITTKDGFVIQHDNWTSWHVSRPFTDAIGARDWLLDRIKQKKEVKPDVENTKLEHRQCMLENQRRLGETVILLCSPTGMCSIFDSMGLEIFSYFFTDYPEVMLEFMNISIKRELERTHAIADKTLSPVVLIPEDFATKQGPLFSPSFLEKVHYPYVRQLAKAWHSHGIKVIYHSDGNYRKAISELIKCGVDGFYCLEPNCHMDIVELKKTWPKIVWAGGIDGVDLMERGIPEQVKKEVRRHIEETDALQTGGMFMASSSEINPSIKPENFKAMVDAVGEFLNPSFL